MTKKIETETQDIILEALARAGSTELLSYLDIKDELGKSFLLCAMMRKQEAKKEGLHFDAREFGEGFLSGLVTLCAKWETLKKGMQ